MSSPEGRLGSHPSLQRSRRNDQERDLQARCYGTVVRCPLTEFEIPDVEPPASVNPVGVDLGLKDLFVLSDGERVPAPRFARTAKRGPGGLRRTSPGRSRVAVPGRRRSAAWLGHRKVSNQRRDFLHKLTTEPDAQVRFALPRGVEHEGMAQLSDLRHASWAHLYSTSFEESIHCTLGYAERPPLFVDRSSR